ncbi:Crp/Fnr family transcriptional regulator [Methylobacterium symbioticum]|uniref:Transcriptional activator protein Anr n=1 Tax=Methylobacterium symbioticum TaxID=2584084 RepID=A0A509E9A2_9HYPH|nr:Crp/Fnr family transcriptional regulator [Methylobacterium symbioticum]VUD70254.1 Transcriptional activator protein Anr [Methylobacterium symbioticum]
MSLYSRLHRPELTASLALGDAAFDALLTDPPRVFRAGTAIVAQGERHDYVYRLRTGWVARIRELTDGRSQYLLVFLPGDIFGVKSMFVLHQPDAVVALSDVTVDRVEYQRLKAAFDGNPDLATRCAWQITEEERRLHNWVVSLGQGSAEERIAYVLREFSERLAGSDPGGKSVREFAMPLTQEQLGNVLGLTPVHVNRVLRRLRQEEIVSVRNRMVRIVNPEALERIARPLQDAPVEPREAEVAEVAG